jgi:hypothetical protein
MTLATPAHTTKRSNAHKTERSNAHKTERSNAHKTERSNAHKTKREPRHTTWAPKTCTPSAHANRPGEPWAAPASAPQFTKTLVRASSSANSRAELRECDTERSEGFAQRAPARTPAAPAGHTDRRALRMRVRPLPNPLPKGEETEPRRENVIAPVPNTGAAKFRPARCAREWPGRTLGYSGKRTPAHEDARPSEFVCELACGAAGVRYGAQRRLCAASTGSYSRSSGRPQT